jgi:hypothetical protein
MSESTTSTRRSTPTGSPTASRFPGGEVVQRSLLGVVTALVVARPLIAGEAGLSPFSTDTGDLVLTLLWLLTGLGWAVWFVWARPPIPRFGLVEAALVVFGALTLASVTQAAYARPARVGMWQTVAVLFAFGLVRVLARTPPQNFALLHALLAGAVGLTVQALASAIWPPTAAAVDPTVAQIFASEPATPEPGIIDPHNAASYLLLFLPVLAAIAVVARQRLRTASWAWLPGGLLVLGLATLGVLHPPGSAAALTGAGGMACLTAGIVAERHRRGWRRAGFVLLALAIGIAVLAPSDPPAGSGSVSQALVNAHAALGVGPGNFHRFVAAFVEPPPAPVITKPPTAFYAVYAASGVFAVIALAFAALALLVRLASVAGRQTEEAESGRPVPWETYAGGLVGLALGFALRPAGETFLTACGWAAVRSFVWFAAFALFDALPRSRRWTTGALGIGLAATLLYLTFGTDGSPAVACILAVVAALALNLCQPPEEASTPRFLLTTLWPMPVATAAILVYAWLDFVPVVGSMQEVREARRFYPGWRSRMDAPSMGPSADAETRLTALRQTRAFLTKRIVPPFERAAVDDEANAAVWSELAWWDGENARLLGEIKRLVDADDRPAFLKEQMHFVQRAIFEAASKAQTLDPQGPTGYRIGYRLRMQVAESTDTTEEQSREQYRMAVRNLERLAEVSPRTAKIPYLIADTEFRVAESIRQQMKWLPLPADTAEAKKLDEELRKEYRNRAESAETAGRAAAVEAQKLDGLAGDTPRGLDAAQREQLSRWLRP